MKTREKIQTEALEALKKNNYNGTVCLQTGTGKSKVAIDAIKEGGFKNILITSPRTNLKENWKNELEKWNISPLYCMDIPTGNYTGNISITLENIQTCYRWGSENFIPQFDLVIYDEIHTCGKEYFSLISTVKEYNIPVLGLTGTPNKSDPWKKKVLYKNLPIIYEYYEAEEDGIVNKTNYYIYEYELSDDYKVLTGTKTKKWYVGEAKQYTYLTEKYEEAKNMMFELGATEYFDTSLLWMKGKQKIYIRPEIGDIHYDPKGLEFKLIEIDATKEQQEAGRKFFYAIRNRKNFLWNLNSSYNIALKLKDKILKLSNNKVLIFSELTSQAALLSPCSIHSNNGKTAKEIEKNNKELLEKFNNGEIKELSSVRYLQLGLNLVGVNYLIFESYSGSETNAKQSVGRGKRLSIDEVANVIIIVPKKTQAEVWHRTSFNWIKNPIVIDSIEKIII